MLTKSRLITIALALVAVGIAYRVEPAKKVLTGQNV